MATPFERGNVATENPTTRGSESYTSLPDRAKSAASQAGQKIEDATQAVGGGMKNLAEAVREKGPREGMLGQASSRVASGLESGAEYLQQHGIKGIADDLTNLVRNNPIPALFVGIGLGFLVARATMRR
jgi:hypothetical protein